MTHSVLLHPAGTYLTLKPGFISGGTRSTFAGGRSRPMRNKKIPSTLEAEKGWDV